MINVTSVACRCFLRSLCDIIINNPGYVSGFIQVEYEKNGFHWNAIEQGRVLGSFYWMHWLTQLPGGILGRRYGSKLIFGCANFVGCFLGFFMPIAAYYDVNYFICLRVVQGMITVNTASTSVVLFTLIWFEVISTGSIMAINSEHDRTVDSAE